MGKRLPSADWQVEKLAGDAKLLAHRKSCTVIAAFKSVTRTIPRVALSPRNLMLGIPGYDDEEGGKNFWRQRELTARLHLEAALLALDVCCVDADRPSVTWPVRDSLTALDKLIDVSAELLSKRTPSTRWRRCERLDRYFPKLKLAKRITAFVRRVGEVTPPRPYGALMHLDNEKDEALAKVFFDRLTKDRDRPVKAVREWREFTPLLLKVQNLRRKQLGEKVKTELRPATVGGLSYSPDAEPYVAFLEVDRFDLLWTWRYQRHLWPLFRWLSEMGNGPLMHKLDPFFAGTFDPVESAIELSVKFEIRRKQSRAAARKAKSRKKLS